MIFIAVGVTTFAACEEKGAMERAGEKVDSAVENTADKLDEAANDAKRKIEDATD